MLFWLQKDWSLSVVVALGHFIWQGLAIALILAATRRIVRSVSIRYGLSVAAMLLMAACPPVTFWLDLSSGAATPAPVTPTAVSVVAEIHSTAPGASHLDNSPDSIGAAADESNSTPNPLVGAVTVMERPTNPSNSPWQQFAPVITSLYLAGVSMMLIRLVIGLLGGRRLRGLSIPVTDSVLLDGLRRQAAALGLRTLPLLARCERVTVPTVIGIMRPTILLPLSLASGLLPQQLELVLAHELAHLRRYDHLVNLVQRVIVSFLFFHPAVWWVSNRIRDEREHCCDDLVVATGAVPLDYAQSLLRVAEISRIGAQNRQRGSSPALSGTALLATGDRPSTLRQRIARLLGYQSELNVRATHPWLVGGLAAGLLGGIWMLTALSWVAVAQSQPVARETASESPSVASSESPPSESAARNSVDAQLDPEHRNSPGTKPVAFREFESLATLGNELVSHLPRNWQLMKDRQIEKDSIAAIPGTYLDTQDVPYVLLKFTEDSARPAHFWNRTDEEYRYLGKMSLGHVHLFVSMKITGAHAPLTPLMELVNWPEARELIPAFLAGDKSTMQRLEDQAEDRYWARSGWGPIQDGLRVMWVVYSREPVAGQPVHVGLELRNFGATPQSYTRWLAHPWRAWQVIGPDGKPVAFRKGSEISSDRVKTLAPNETDRLFAGVNIAELFDLSRPGRYTLRFTGKSVREFPDTSDLNGKDSRPLPAALDLTINLQAAARPAEQNDPATREVGGSLAGGIRNDTWGAASSGLRSRLVPVSASMDEDSIDMSRVLSLFPSPADLGFALELENVSDQPISLADTRYGDGYGESKGKANSNWYAQFLFSIDLFDGQGQRIERPAVEVVDLDGVLQGAQVKVLEPGKTHRFLLRPAKWLSPLGLRLEPGEYRAAVHYHGVPKRVADRIREYRTTSAALGVVDCDVVSPQFKFEISSPFPIVPRKGLVWGMAENGLRAAAELVPQRATYAQGQKPDVRLHVQNVSDKAITFASPLWLSDLNAAVKNEQGVAIPLNTVFYSGWTLSSRATLQPGQSIVYDAGNLGLAQTLLEAEKFEHVTNRKLIAPVGSYLLELSGGFGNSFLLKDGKGKVLAPLPGDWIGELKTGAMPLTVTEQEFQSFDCDIIDAATGQAVTGTVVSFRFVKPASGDQPRETVSDLFWGPHAPSRIYFTIPQDVYRRADRDQLFVEWSVGQRPDYETFKGPLLSVKELIEDSPKSARESLRQIKLTRRTMPAKKEEGGAERKKKLLEFRFVALPADRQDGPRIPDELSRQLKSDSSPAEVMAVNVKGFRWFPVSSAEQVPALPVEVKKGEVRMVLLSDSAEHAMLSDGDWTIETCEATQGQKDRYSVRVVFNEAGGKLLHDLTKSHLRQQMAVVINGEVLMAPVVQSAIRREVEITGKFDKQQAEKLAAELRGDRSESTPTDKPLPE